MNILTYIQYQIRCLARSHNLWLMLQNSLLSALPIAMLWVYPFIDSEPVKIYACSILNVLALTAASENIFAWHYGSVLFLYYSPFPLLKRLSLLMPLLYNLAFIAIIEIVLFFIIVRTTLTPAKYALILVCWLVSIAASISEVFFVSLHRAMVIKKNAFSFGEKTPQPKPLSPRRIPMLILPTLIPIVAFYSIGQFQALWFLFGMCYIMVIYGLLYRQLQSVATHAYAARFQLYQSLKG